VDVIGEWEVEEFLPVRDGFCFPGPIMKKTPGPPENERCGAAWEVKGIQAAKEGRVFL